MIQFRKIYFKDTPVNGHLKKSVICFKISIYFNLNELEHRIEVSLSLKKDSIRNQIQTWKINNIFCGIFIFKKQMDKLFNLNFFLQKLKAVLCILFLFLFFISKNNVIRNIFLSEQKIIENIHLIVLIFI